MSSPTQHVNVFALADRREKPYGTNKPWIVKWRTWAEGSAEGGHHSRA